jgi:hypothetical protein
MSTYRVTVYTGNLSPAAGVATGANVYVTLYGDQGSSDEVVLDNAGNNFAQGAVDTFMIRIDDLGDLVRLRVRHDNKFPFPGWYLDRIFIRNEDLDQEWTFPCNRWLAPDEDDGEIERVLNAA